MTQHQRRSNGWQANPQAVAAISARAGYDGHPDLGRYVDRDTWLTPPYILAGLGKFDLDPCASEHAPGWTGCQREYTKSDDGLRRTWQGRVFMNPPFSDTRPWLAYHAVHGCGISLVPASIESVVWREYVWPRAKAILMLHGRTRFCNPDGSTTTGRPLRSVCLIAWSQWDRKILEATEIAGVLLTEWVRTP